MKGYVDKIGPNVGDVWRADEVWIKVKGNLKYLFALIDDETRYWIAQEVADSKHMHDAAGLLHEGKQLMEQYLRFWLRMACHLTAPPLTKSITAIQNPNPDTSTRSNLRGMRGMRTTQDGKNQRRDPRQGKDHARPEKEEHADLKGYAGLS